MLFNGSWAQTLFRSFYLKLWAIFSLVYHKFLWKAKRMYCIEKVVRIMKRLFGWWSHRTVWLGIINNEGSRSHTSYTNAEAAHCAMSVAGASPKFLCLAYFWVKLMSTKVVCFLRPRYTLNINKIANSFSSHIVTLTLIMLTGSPIRGIMDNCLIHFVNRNARSNQDIQSIQPYAEPFNGPNSCESSCLACLVNAHVRGMLLLSVFSPVHIGMSLFYDALGMYPMLHCDRDPSRRTSQEEPAGKEGPLGPCAPGTIHHKQYTSYSKALLFELGLNNRER